MTSVNQPLLFEMIRSFVTLARTLNLSHAVEELKSTRQTVRRHIEALESAMGAPLFEVKDRRYQLTHAGEQMLPSAQSIQAQGRLFLRGDLGEVDGMMRMAYEDGEGWYFYIQKQKISSVWDCGSGLLPAAVQAWAASKGELESDAMNVVRPFVLVYRDTPAGWLCSEVGENSFFRKWWGRTKALSSVGRPLDQFPGGPEVAAIMKLPFVEVQTTKGIRLDQVATLLPRGEDGAPTTIVFNRLLMAARLPDGSDVLVVVVDRANQLMIADLDSAILERIPDDVVLEF